MGSRAWIKIYCDKWLFGTIREEQPVIRAIWIDLLTLTGSGRYGDIGEIKLSDGIGLTDNQIAGILKIPLEVWLEAKKRLIETERVSIVEDNNIVITNWQKYQSEYERQRIYKEKSQKDITTESYGEKENRKRIEGEEKRREEKRRRKEGEGNNNIVVGQNIEKKLFIKKTSP